MSLDPVTAALDVGGKLLDKFFPDADAEMKNKMQPQPSPKTTYKKKERVSR